MKSKKNSLLILLILTGVLLLQAPASIAQKTKNSQLSDLKVKAQKELEVGHYQKADALFVQAIADAKRAGNNAELLELISNLVRERCTHKRITDVDSYVEMAIQTVKSLKGSRSYDPEMSVWMHDLADVLYTQGSQESDKAIREYCAKKYVIISCLVHERLDSQIGSRAQYAISSLEEIKDYKSTVELLEALVSYVKRVAPHDAEKQSDFYYSLGIAYLAANQPDKADAAFQTCLNLDKRLVRKGPMHDLHVIMIERYSAMAKLEQGKLPEAETLGRTCVNNHAKYISPVHLFTAGDYLMLANILKKAGKTAEAATYYSLALNAFDTLAKTVNPREFDAGRAIACEGLAEMDSKTGKSLQAIQLRGKVSSLRQIHSNFPPKITDEDVFFFTVWGHFPTPIDPFQQTSQ